MNWNQGAFDDGYSARYVHEVGLDQCPSPDTYGQFATDSWRAGWYEADKEKRTTPTVPVEPSDVAELLKTASVWSSGLVRHLADALEAEHAARIEAEDNRNDGLDAILNEAHAAGYVEGVEAAAVYNCRWCREGHPRNGDKHELTSRNISRQCDSDLMRVALLPKQRGEGKEGNGNDGQRGLPFDEPGGLSRVLHQVTSPVRLLHLANANRIRICVSQRAWVQESEPIW